MATPIASTHSISHPIHHEILSLKRLLIWTFHTFWSNKKHKATPRAFIGPECFLLDQNVASQRLERRKCCVRKIQEKKSQRLERRKCCVTIDNKAFRERVLVAFGLPRSMTARSGDTRLTISNLYSQQHWWKEYMWKGTREESSLIRHCTEYVWCTKHGWNIVFLERWNFDYFERNFLKQCT